MVPQSPALRPGHPAARRRTRRHAHCRVLLAIGSQAVALAALVLLGGCSEPPPTRATTTAVAHTSEPTTPQPTTPQPTTPPTTPPTTTASPTPSTPALQPLTGGPVLAVKIDNTGGSRPRVGVNQADVVYVEPVEGGLTRLLAIFSTAQPGEVGPVRSARESDVQLLANYGPVAFAFSGASAVTLPILGGGHQVNLSFDAAHQGYRRDGDRPAPYNVIGSPPALLARAGGSVPPADVGLRFGPASPGGVPAAQVSTRWPASGIQLSWDPGRRRYLVTTDGTPDVDADGTQHAAATVIVQVVDTHLSQNRDVNGVQTPVVDVVGGGAATVVRDGLAWTGEWSRPTAEAPTSFTANGQPIAMAPGPVWVLLVPSGQAAQVG